MHCFAQCPWIVFVFLGVTLDSAKIPFAKTPFSRFQIFFFSDFFLSGGSVWGFSGSSLFFCFLGLFSFAVFLAERAGEKKQKKNGLEKQVFSVYFSCFAVCREQENLDPEKHQTHPQREQKKQKEKQTFSVRFIFSFFLPGPFSRKKPDKKLKNWNWENRNLSVRKHVVPPLYIYICRRVLQRDAFWPKTG